jgi:guanylate kinase
MSKGLLVIISGPSGVGKGTLRREVMKDPSLNLWYSVSMTTRPMRPGEVEGKDYYFVSEKEFDENLKKGNLLEWNEFVGHRYGTPCDKLMEKLDEGKNAIIEIDVNGAKQVLKRCESLSPVSIFIVPPSFEALEERIRGRRTESEEVIQERLQKAKREMAVRGEYQHVVSNDDISRAAAEIASIIKGEIAKRERA